MIWPDIQSVPLSSIDREDLTYRISTSTDPDALAPSMHRIGLLCPPVLIPERDIFRIVCGFARIAAAGKLEWKKIPGRILPKEASHRTCAEFAVIDNCAGQALNPVEQGRCLMLLSSITKDVDRLVTWANELGLRVNNKMASKLMMIPQMTHRLQDGLIHQSIALPVALQIHEMEDTESIESLSDFLLEMNLSLNRQRELISWIEAISRQEGKTIRSVLNEPDLLALQYDKQTDIRQKSKMIRLYLKRRRYPHMVQAEERYQAYRQQIDLTDQIELVPPPFFESDKYSLRISFKTPNDLDAAQKKIKEIADSSALKELLKFV